MNITAATTIHDLVEEYPYLLGLARRATTPTSRASSNPALFNTMARVATVEIAATDGGRLGGAAPRRHPHRDRAARDRRRGDRGAASGAAGRPRESARRAKRRSRPSSTSSTTACPSTQVKAEFDALIAGVDSAEIARMEQALIAEGMPVEDVQRLCDVHVTVFKESLDEKPSATVAAGHPVDAYRRENAVATQLVADLEPRCSARSRPRPTPTTAPPCSRASRRSWASSRRSTRTTPARRTSSSPCSRRTASRGRPRSCGRSTTTSADASRPRARCSRPATRPRWPPRCPRRSR